ncbi:MAG: DUF58 domain-containing protein [Lachnospiraceae bacterium]|nr:DUF58 domain-containing protein [Lachnospiraceae bacterium]
MKLFIALFVGAALFLLQLYLYKRLWDRGLKIDIDFAEPIVREGDGNELIETIVNGKFLPLPVVQVKFAITRSFEFTKQDNSAVTDQYYRNDYYSMLPYRKITRTYSFKCTKRGYYRMNGMDVVCKDLFLTGMMLKTYEHEAAVCVLPGRIGLESFPVTAKELTGNIVDRIRKNEDPFEFAGIREYQSYDPVNRINWKASAASGELRVNKFNTTFTRKVAICVNAECHIKWHEDVFLEEEIRIAATLAAFFIEKHIPVALKSNGCDILNGNLITIEAGADLKHLRNIEISLARLIRGDKPAEFAPLLKELLERNRYDDTEYIIISNYRKQDLIDTYGTFKNAGINISWIIPEYSTVTPKLTASGDKSIIKWTVTNA